LVVCAVIPWVALSEGDVLAALAVLMVPAMVRILGRSRVVMPVTVVHEDESSLTLAIHRPDDAHPEPRMPLPLGILVFGLLFAFMAVPLDILWRSFNPVVFLDNPAWEPQAFLLDAEGQLALRPGLMTPRRLHIGTHRFTLLSPTGPAESWTQRVRWNTRYVATIGPPSCYVNVVDGIHEDTPSRPRRWSRVPDGGSLRRTRCASEL